VVPIRAPPGRKRGVNVMAKTISTLVPGGIKFNAVAIINYDGFKKLVTALGGVKMCIDTDGRVRALRPERQVRHQHPGPGHPGYTYKPACRTLKPWEALDYVRQREDLPHGDYVPATAPAAVPQGRLRQADEQGNPHRTRPSSTRSRTPPATC
jgi:anionic cell wall polymer biosynthesis LytR-Cps2A-Psr (LCP) family protein